MRSYRTSAAKMKGNLAVYVFGNMLILYTPIDPNGINFDSIILGAVEFREYDNEVSVQSIWSRKGYGPLLYLLSSEWAMRKGLIPNQRKGMISPSAKRIWKEFYSGKGRNFVKIEDHENSPHEEPYLRIKIKPKRKGKLPALRKKSDQFLYNDKYGEKETLLIETANSLLRKEMSKIYGQ